MHDHQEDFRHASEKHHGPGTATIDALVLNEQDTRAFFNNGNGRLIPGDQSLGAMAAATTGEVVLADVNGDGLEDAVLARQIYPSEVWLNQGDEHFVFAEQFVSSIGIAVADVNGDGEPDVLSGIGDTTSVLFGNGNGHFADSGQNLGQVGNFGDVALADLNGDGYLDAVLGDEAGPSTIHLNDGKGNFADTGQSLTDAVLSAAVGDLNGDGTPDLYFGRNGHDQVFFNDGAGRFSDSGQLLFIGRSWDVALGDVNADGELDVVIATGDPGPGVWLNEGGGRFSHGDHFSDLNAVGVALADLDADGMLDAVFANFEGPNRVWLNIANGDFTDTGQRVGDGRNLDVALGEIGPALAFNRDADHHDRDPHHDVVRHDADWMFG